MGLNEIIMKPTKRKCPQCGVVKLFRADQKTCGCIKEPSSDREEFLRAKNTQLEAQVKQLQRDTGSLKELTDALVGAVKALEPAKLQPYKKGTKAEAEIAAVFKLSDWHTGAFTPASATEGFGSFNWAKQQAAIDYIGDKFLGWIATHRLAFNIPKLYILSEGDMISGDIHYELQVTNEFPAPVQAVKAGDLLGRMIAKLAPHFPEVHVSEINIDNHSRLTKKLQFAQGDENSWGYVVHAIANKELEKHRNVNIIQAKGIRQVITVQGIKFLTEHGHTTKCYMGVPYYGIERQRGKEAAKRIQAMLDQQRREVAQLQRDIGFDFMSIGHWHVPGIVSGNILINGCLPGTTEYDHAAGRYAPPSQVSFLVHPKYKIFDWTSWMPKY